ncbi:hypothetical protein ACFL60_04515 [Candidatus Omnitrophota bacterium]
MRILSNVALALNILWLLVLMFFVGTQGTESYDIIGYSVLTLVVVTPIVNLIVLWRNKQ